MPVAEEVWNVVPGFRNAFAAAWTITRLGLSQVDSFTLFADVVQRQGHRYCPLALELLFSIPEDEPPAEPPLSPAEAQRLAVEAEGTLPEETEPWLRWERELPEPDPVVFEPVLEGEFLFPGVPSEPREEETFFPL